MYPVHRFLHQHKNLRMLISILACVLSAVLQVFILQVFMDPCNLISGGFTGIALFVHKLGLRSGISIPTSLMIVLLNTPCAVFCYKFISKRFVLLSCIQYFLVSILLSVFHFQPIFDDVMLNLLFGGIAWGFSNAIALQAGGSTGGTDFIAQYVSNKIHRSIFNYVFYFNCCMYVLYGILFGWLYAGYSIIFQYLSTQAIQSFYHRYTQVTVSITTYNPDEVIDAFFAVVQHGMSVIEATGAFKGQKVYICESVISAFELQEVVHNVRVVDPRCIINTWKTNSFVGNFRQKPLE